MIIFFRKSQLHLFDAPVHVSGSVRKDGAVIPPHIRIQKVAAKKPPAETTGDLFADQSAAVTTQSAAGVVTGKDPVVMDRKEAIKEHERLVDVLRSPSHDDDKAEAKKQAAELAEYKAPGSVDAPVSAAAEKAPKTEKKPKRAARKKAAEAAPPLPLQAPEPVAAPTVAPAQHDRMSPFGVPAGATKAERRAINSQVAALVADGQTDRDMMRQYSGGGGCGDSLNEYYTDPGVARAMWDTLQRLGAYHGTALEPSCGTGVFLHTAPAGFRVTGVELDPTSSACALALHGDRHEIHTASLERFATTDDRQFDVVIGNPPYGPRGFLAKDDKVGLTTAEAYFTDTALDKCKPGGLVALVVPTGIVDSGRNRALREAMLTKAQFLGAQRMPNTAFEHSHTEVTTDVIYLRKRADDVAGALATVDQATLKKLGVWDEEFLAGSYFTEGRGAGNVLGSMEAGWRAKAGIGNDITVTGSMVGVADAIAEFSPHPESVGVADLAVPQILDALPDEAARDAARAGAMRRPYANMAKVGDTKTVDGVNYVLQGDPPRWHRVDEFMQSEAISDAQALAQRIKVAMDGGGREGLEAEVRAYVAKHGIPANNPDLMTAASVDKSLFRLIGAVNRKGELSDAVLGRERKVEGSFDSVAQAMALDERGDFSAADLAEKLGRDPEEVADQLAADQRYAYVGAGRWTTMDAYLTGELWPKLDAARAAVEAGDALKEKLQHQVRRLEEVIDPKSLDDVEVQINSAFLPLHVLEAYFNWRQFDSDRANEWTKKQPAVSIKFEDGVYTIAGGNTWGDSKLLDKYLNRTGVKKDDKPTLDEWNREFKEWLCASAYRDAVEDLYNRKFRGFVAREFSDAPIDVPGLTTERDVRSWRWSSLRRSLADGKGIIADDVGLGKTLGGLLLARMAKIDGRAKKPITVVPKSVLANWFAESQAWFPGSRVLTIGANFSYGKDGELVGKDDSAAERKRKYHDLTQNDYDFVFISEPAFEEVDLSPERKEEYYGEDFWVQRGDKIGNAGDKRRKRIKEQFEQSVASREFQDRTDAIYFEQLGCDMLIADEMHHQKNLYAAKARFGEQPKFLGGQGLSNRALDFNLKTRWVREQNGGKNVYGLTATPTKNSPLEIYSMLSHIAPEAFEKIGIRNSEEFLDRFCEFTGDKVLSTQGDIEDALVVSGFKNMTELREIMARFIDRRTADEVGLKLPSRDDRLHLVDMTAKQQEVYAGLRELADQAKKKDSTGDAHIFSVMDKMNKAALDLQLLGSEHAGAASPKYVEMAKQAKAGLADGAQLIFSEYIDSHERIAAALVDAGVPRNRIGIINAQVAGSAVKRQNIAEALNSGKLDVVIGNATMAEGLNMQVRTTDIHHADVPWEPATLQQRNGRGLRQGNRNEALRVHTYLSRGSFDGYRYQSVGAKKDWQDLLWNGGDRVDNLAREGQFTRDDMRIMLAADPEAARAEFEKDKAAAQQRYDAGQRVEAVAELMRFQDMKRSYAGLKNKGTASATRLRQKLEAARTSLFNNKHFPDKSILDSDTDVLIEPDSGHVLRAGVGLDYGAEGRFVVSGVNMRAGTVTMRRYADTSGGRPVTVPLKDLAGGIKPFKFDADAEAADVKVALESQANEKVNSISSFDDLKNMPSRVLEANNDSIQRQLKEGVKSYKISPPYEGVMIERESGKMVRVPSYNVAKLADTHDFLLPTEANKEKAIQAWMDARRGAKYGTDYVSAGGRSKQTKLMARREYPGAEYNAKHINPFKSVLDSLSGGSGYGQGTSALERQAKQRLEAEQYERIRRAPTFAAALQETMPLGSISGASDAHSSSRSHVKYPKKALTMLWAKARHFGSLGDKLKQHEQQGKYGGLHNQYAYSHSGDKSVHAALMSMARDSGHEDLVSAMAQSAVRHKVEPDARETAEALHHGFNHSASRVRELKSAVERAGLTDHKKADARFPSGGLLSNDNQWSPDANKKIGDILAERLAREERKEAA